jgi:flagellar hook-basal body complex protein FliE
MIDPVTLKAPPLVGAAQTPRITGAEVSAGGLLPADFSQVLSQLASNATQTLKSGEAMSLAGMQGKVSTQEVVSAVMEAEQTLQTAIALRDKAVAAYLELSRMAI